jgi:hypothetical protein
MPTSYLEPRQLSMLLRTPVKNAKHMMSTLRDVMGQAQAARLLQERPHLLFQPGIVSHLARHAERIAAVYGISKVRPASRADGPGRILCGCRRMCMHAGRTSLLISLSVASNT